MAAQRRFRITVAVVVACSLVPLAYSVFHQAAHRQARPATGTDGSAYAATNTIVYRYGVPGVPGAGPDHLFNPDDAMLTPAGVLISADIKNCRIVIITPPAHTVTRVIGQTTNAGEHDPPRRIGSPNGAFPMTSGHYLAVRPWL
jgi:hypothetical protein